MVVMLDGCDGFCEDKSREQCGQQQSTKVFNGLIIRENILSEGERKELRMWGARRGYISKMWLTTKWEQIREQYENAIALLARSP